MVIEEELRKLVTTIEDNYPTVTETDLPEWIPIINKLQKYLAEVLLQIRQILPNDSVILSPEELANLSNFCMALSLLGKSTLTKGRENSIRNDTPQKKWDFIFRKIYWVNAMLDPNRTLSEEAYEEGLTKQYTCTDPITHVERKFTFIARPRFTVHRENKLEQAYLEKIQNIQKELDPNHNESNPRTVGSLLLPSNATPSAKFHSLSTGQLLREVFKAHNKVSEPNSGLNSEPAPLISHATAPATFKK